MITKPINGDESLVNCQCAPHQSATGPAAYLVELYNGLATISDTVGGPTWQHELDELRPDIQHLELSEANTETLIPEIDLVNELLEAKATRTDAAWPQYTGHQTSHPESELSATPEFSAPPTSASQPWMDIASTCSPCPLPYDLPLDETRTYLEAISTSRYEVMKAFNKSVSAGQNPDELNAPDSLDLVWEYLRFNAKEKDILTKTDQPDELNLYFAFTPGTADADILGAMNPLNGFLRHAELSLEEFRGLLAAAGQPAWLPIVTDLAAKGCDLPSVKVGSRLNAGLPEWDAAVLHRLHRYLRLWRWLGGHISDFEDLNKLLTSLEYYQANGGGFALNAEFFPELAALKQLCHSIDSQEMKGDRTPWSFRNEGLIYAATPTNRAGMLAAVLTSLNEHGLAVNRVNLLLDMCGLTLAGKPTSLRESLRFIQLVQRLVLDRIKPEILCHVLCGITAGAKLTAAGLPADPPYDLNFEFWKLNRAYATANPAPTPCEINDLWDELRGLYTRRPASELDAVKQSIIQLAICDFSVVLADSIADSGNNVFARIRAAFLQPHPAAPQFGYAPGSGYELLMPFIETREQQNPTTGSTQIVLRLKNPSEEEFIFAMGRLRYYWTDWNQPVPDNPSPQSPFYIYKIARDKAAALFNKPRSLLHDLQFILPNQRLARIALLDGHSSNTQATYGYIRSQVLRLKNTLVDHVQDIVLKSASQKVDESTSRQLSNALVFEEIASSASPDHSVFKDLLPIRGGALSGEYYTAGPNPVRFKRLDSDLSFTSVAGSSPRFHPRGWGYNTLEPGQVPENHVYQPGNHNAQEWFAKWKGWFHSATAGFIRFGCDLTGNSNCVTMRCGMKLLINGVEALNLWNTNQKGFEESDPIQVPLGFVQIEVLFFSKPGSSHNLDGVASLNLLMSDFAGAATSVGSATIPVDEGFFHVVPPFDYAALEISDFAKAYGCLWRAATYCAAFDLRADEVHHLQPRGNWQPNRPTGTQAFKGMSGGTTVNFDLNEFGLQAHPLQKRLALLDQAEQISFYTEFRRKCAAPSELLPYVTVAAHDPALSNVALEHAPFTLLTALAQTRGWDLPILKVVTSFANGAATHKLSGEALQGAIWLMRIEESYGLMERLKPWWSGSLPEADAALLLREMAGGATNQQSSLRSLIPCGRDDGGEGAGLKPLQFVTDELRQRSRDALHAYLRVSRNNRTGRTPLELSMVTECDTEVCESPRVTRVQSAILAIQRFCLAKSALDNLNSLPFRLTSYDQWAADKEAELYPENHAIWSWSTPSLAYTEFQNQLRHQVLTLRGNPAITLPAISGLESLGDFERLSSPQTGTAGESYDWSKSAIEPHESWLSPEGSIANADDGWQPGPIDITRSVYLEVGSDIFMFWTVPVRDWEHDDHHANDSEPAIPPADVVITTPVAAFRLGWSQKEKTAERWSLPNYSDGWIVSTDSEPEISPSAIGSTEIEVTLSGTTATTPSSFVVSILQNRANSSPSAYPLGGFRKLPTSWTSSLATSNAASIGLTAWEMNYLCPVRIGIELSMLGQFESSCRWLSLAAPLSLNIDWDDLNGLAPADADERTKKRDTVLRHLEIRLQWANSLFASNQEENVRKAEAIYLAGLAALGDRPRHADCLARTGGTVANPSANAFIAALNPRLLQLWTEYEDKRLKLANYKSVRGIGRMLAVNHSDMFTRGNSDTTVWSGQYLKRSPLYRFGYLLAKAEKSAATLVSFSSTLLSAIEKRDAEHLGLIKAAQDSQIAHRMRDERLEEWKAAEIDWRALRQAHSNAEFRRDYYAELLSNGLISGEIAHLTELGVSIGLLAASQILELAGQIGSNVPDTEFRGHAQGLASGASTGATVLSGTRIALGFQLGGRALQTVASILNTQASIDLTNAGYDRRRREWIHSRDGAKREVKALSIQIDAAYQRMHIAQERLNTQDQQWLHSQRIERFLREKGSSAALYDWSRLQLLEVANLVADVATRNALRAQDAYQYERGFSSREFIRPLANDPLGSWLSSGEHLQSQLQQLEEANDEEQQPEEPFVQEFSLRIHAPGSLLQLRLTGSCELELGEWMFDLVKPGYYMRRIKHVAVEADCPIGPFDTVNCTARLLSHATRINPLLADGYDCEPHFGSTDARFVRQLGDARDRVSLNSLPEELPWNPSASHPTKLGPCEGCGVVSRWKIEVPLNSNPFAGSSITDVRLRVVYSAIHGGEKFAEAAHKSATSRLPSSKHPGEIILALRTDCPGEWAKLSSSLGKPEVTACLELHPALFRRSVVEKTTRIIGVQVLFTTTDSDAGSSSILVQGMIGKEEIQAEICEVPSIRGAFWGKFQFSATQGIELGAHVEVVTLKLVTHDGNLPEMSGAYVAFEYASELLP